MMGAQTPATERAARSATGATRDLGRRRRFTHSDGWLTRSGWLSFSIYWGIHASCLLVFVVGAPPAAVALGIGTYLLRVLAITAGYHRYFAHRSFRTGRAFQFLLALTGCAATQKGPLWWAGTHRLHHRFADAPGDPHSPKRGFYYAHQGWVFDSHWEGTPLEEIRDFSAYPELRFINQHHWLPPVALALLCFAVLGLPGVVWGFSISTTLLWHATYSVNSFAHVFGRRRYQTQDDSRNNWWVALLTMGEGWHNNHHHYMNSARNGFYWWEIDITWYLLRALAALGVVWNLKTPPLRIRDGGQRRIRKWPEAA